MEETAEEGPVCYRQERRGPGDEERPRSRRREGPRVLLAYCLLVPFCYGLIVLLPVGLYAVVSKRFGLLGYLLLFSAYYVWLVLAHLLGRFYWKYEERLNWDA